MKSEWIHVFLFVIILFNIQYGKWNGPLKIKFLRFHINTCYYLIVVRVLTRRIWSRTRTWITSAISVIRRRRTVAVIITIATAISGAAAAAATTTTTAVIITATTTSTAAVARTMKKEIRVCYEIKHLLCGFAHINSWRWCMSSLCNRIINSYFPTVYFYAITSVFCLKINDQIIIAISLGNRGHSPV